MAKMSLKHLRASLGMTQKKLAEKALITETAVIAIEKNQVKPRLLTAYAIVNALNTELKAKNRPEVTIESFTWSIMGEDV